MSNHTPTPWTLHRREPDNYRTLIAGRENIYIGTTYQYGMAGEQQEDNAAHIVKCVNTHDELVAALAGIVKLGPEYCSERPSSSDFDAAYDKARAILEMVGGHNG